MQYYLRLLQKTLSITAVLQVFLKGRFETTCSYADSFGFISQSFEMSVSTPVQLNLICGAHSIQHFLKRKKEKKKNVKHLNFSFQRTVFLGITSLAEGIFCELQNSPSLYLGGGTYYKTGVKNTKLFASLSPPGVGISFVICIKQLLKAVKVKNTDLITNLIHMKYQSVLQNGLLLQAALSQTPHFSPAEEAASVSQSILITFSPCLPAAIKISCDSQQPVS